MVTFLRIFTGVYLVSVIAFGAGVYVMKSKSWPYKSINEILLFIEGDPNSKASITEKIVNDLNIHPTRQWVTYKPNQKRRFVSLTVPDLRERREQPLVYLDDGAANGYRLIYGVLDFEENMHGAILLDANGEYVHSWQVTESHLDWKTSSELNKFPHGFLVRPNGSIIFGFSRSSSLQQFDACSKPVWSTRGRYHHALSQQSDDVIWAMRDHQEIKSDYMNSVIKMEAHTGKVLKEFSMGQIMAANAELSIFDVQDVLKSNALFADAFHPNDVEPLPEAMASAYPGFSAGDLLISLRSNSLVFVVDPETLKVKWWRFGPWIGQHDPDWQPDGRITIYNNNQPRKGLFTKNGNYIKKKTFLYERDYSNIVSIDPSTFSTEVVIDGKVVDFFSGTRGKHQVLPNGNVLITSTNQGRVLEVSPQNEIVFEFINLYSTETNKNLPVSEAIFLPEDFFNEGALGQCGS
jgi:hypothetical protein